MKVKKPDIYASGEIASEEEMKTVLLRANFERQRQQQLQTTAHELSSVNNRARGVGVGTAFGGAIELTLRRPDGVCTYAIFQPMEAIEIIHQIGAACGCHIRVQPRDDFASWRKWRDVDVGEDVDARKDVGEGHPPITGREMPPPEKQPGVNASLMASAAVKGKISPTVTKNKKRRNGGDV